MAYIGNQPALQYITFAKQTFTANGSTVAFTLDNSVANENELEVFVNNVRQEPGSGKAYTASGTTLTMSEAPNTGDDFYCIYQGRATGTVTPGNGTVHNDHLASGAFSNITGVGTLSAATISGDLTVDTSTLKVDSTNNRVGVGTSSPDEELHVESSANNLVKSKTTTSTALGGFEAHSSGGTSYIKIHQLGPSFGGTTFGGVTGNDQSLIEAQAASSLAFSTQGGTPDIIFAPARTARMTIKNGGNVGIGTSSPLTKFEVYDTSNGGVITAHKNSEADGDYTGYEFHTNSSSTEFKKGAIYFRANGTGYGRGDIVFCNDRVANAGNVSLSDEKVRIADTGRIHTNATTSPTGHLNLIGERGASYRAIQFEHTNGGGAVGNITTGSSSVAYNTSSDYRLKENVSYDFDATTRLKQLKPARFNFIADVDKTVDGFLAHEVSSIVPEAIDGTKDAVQIWEEGEELPEGVSVGDNKLDENGNTIPEYQGIDQSKLVPLLVKTIQELEARITALES